MDTTRRRRRGEGEGDEEEDEDGNENGGGERGGGGGGGVTEMFRLQTMDAPFVRHSLARPEREERNACIRKKEL